MIIHMFTSPPTHLTSPAGLLAGPSSNPGMPAVGTEAIDDVQLRCATRGRVNVVSGPCREESKATTNSLSGQGSGLGRGKRRASFLKVRMKRSGTSNACSRVATYRALDTLIGALRTATASGPRVSQRGHDTAQAARQ